MASEHFSLNTCVGTVMDADNEPSSAMLAEPGLGGHSLGQAQLRDLELRLEREMLLRKISDCAVGYLQEELERLKSMGIHVEHDPKEPHVAATAAKPALVEANTVPSDGLNEHVDASESSIRTGVKQALMKHCYITLFFPSLRTQMLLIEKSDFFDEAWYVRAYPDLRHTGMPPSFHYLRYGAQEHRDPSPRFSTQRYLWLHPEIDPGVINPLVHFLKSNS